MSDQDNTKPAKKRRGFAAMSPEKQREIAAKGGKSAHVKGTAHEFTVEEARSAGVKGGRAAAQKKNEPPPEPV
jgi:general stress protein YciG